ncbi:YrdB family protein [Microbacterium gorillae]|uniref:YrdB family protein n=1 Tax=Microbacterium gorillae TaxID=1231063 RepID=UPI00058D22B8|nr:YrdB family protein [Microbacterium gorillae]
MSASPSSTAATPEPGTRAPLTALEIVRTLVIIVALVTFALWGFLGFEFPWNLVAGIGTPVVVLLLWALFVSPRAVVHVHPFVRVLIELLIFAGATIAWWSMGQTWIGLAYAVVAVATGVITGRRSLS